MIPDFPEFTDLNIELKHEYNTAVRPFTPYADITFAALQIWWNISEKLKVSRIGDNIVIDYRLFHDEANSGLSLIGVSDIDNSIATLFDYLESESRNKRLVHVPEFTIESISDTTKFRIIEEDDYSEYILSSEALSKLEGPEYHLLRKKIRRFGRETADKEVLIKELDLTLDHIQDELFRAILDWQSSNKPENDPENTEHEALKQSFKHSRTLELKNFALYINNELHGILIYHRPLGKEYFVLHHLKANYDVPYISDFMYHHVAKNAHQSGVTKLNIEMDLGIETLKKHKMTLRPTEFLKKYTILTKQH